MVFIPFSPQAFLHSAYSSLEIFALFNFKKRSNVLGIYGHLFQISYVCITKITTMLSNFMGLYTLLCLRILNFWWPGTWNCHYVWPYTWKYCFSGDILYLFFLLFFFFLLWHSNPPICQQSFWLLMLYLLELKPVMDNCFKYLSSSMMRLGISNSYNCW